MTYTVTSRNSVFSRSFVNGDLAAGVLSVTHNLGTSAPIIAVYDNLAGLVVSTVLIPTPYTVLVVSPNQVAVTIVAGLLPLIGTWNLTLLG